eukprot:6840682-Prymnesium_polylepis.1
MTTVHGHHVIIYQPLRIPCTSAGPQYSRHRIAYGRTCRLPTLSWGEACWGNWSCSLLSPRRRNRAARRAVSGDVAHTILCG